jgi:hypothetical protein
MDELVALVSQKTGLSPEHSRTAVETVIGFLKKKLPAPLAGQLDSALSGTGSGALGEAAKAIGGMFGKQ